jgi:hypothetical protein
MKKLIIALATIVCFASCTQARAHRIIYNQVANKWMALGSVIYTDADGKKMGDTIEMKGDPIMYGYWVVDAIR